MSALSISGAWEDTKALLGRDGRLFASVALALIVLPSAVMGVADPRVEQGDAAPGWFNVMILVVFLISLAGQLALIRLALGPSVTVGGAIGHGFRRLLRYVLAVIILFIGLVMLSLPFVFAAVGVGVNVEASAVEALTGPVVWLLILYLIVILVLMTRFTMAMPVASVESAGPLSILSRSWRLTSGHWLKLFGFLIVFSIAGVIVLLAVGVVLGSLTALLFDSRGPMTVAALIEGLIGAVVTGIFSVLFTLMLARIYVQLSGRDTVEKPA
jgi:hypothetical protein